MTAYNADDFDDAIEDNPSARVLWPGDSGGLPYIARQACVALMKRTHVWSGANKRSALLWQAIQDHQDEIDARLNSFFLELHLDERNQIAYKLQVDRTGGQPWPTLLYGASYSRDEIEALLHLRREHMRALSEGDDSAYIDRTSLLDMLKMSRSGDVLDHKAADTRSKTAIDRLAKDGFLLTDGADPDRLRISPFVETLLTVERLPAFIDALLAADPTTTATTEETISYAE